MMGSQYSEMGGYGFGMSSQGNRIGSQGDRMGVPGLGIGNYGLGMGGYERGNGGFERNVPSSAFDKIEEEKVDIHGNYDPYADVVDEPPRKVIRLYGANPPPAGFATKLPKLEGQPDHGFYYL